MGYYTTVNMEMEVPIDKIESLKKAWDEEVKRETPGTFNYAQSWQLEIEDNRLNNGEVRLNEYYAKFDNPDAFVHFLAEHGVTGTLEGQGEDPDDRWKYEITNEGEVIEYGYEWIPHGNLLTHFLNTYKKRLNPETINDIKRIIVEDKL